MLVCIKTQGTMDNTTAKVLGQTGTQRGPQPFRLSPSPAPTVCNFCGFTLSM